MGSSKFSHPLSKISVVGVGAVLAICILSTSVQNAATKSVMALPSSVEVATEDDNSESPSTVPPTTPPSSPVELNENSPNYTLILSSYSNSTEFHFKLGEDAKLNGFRIAVHLKDCDYSGNYNINLLSNKTNSTDWSCREDSKEDNNDDSPEQTVDNKDHPFTARLNWWTQGTLDNLEEILLTHNFRKPHRQHNDSLFGIGIQANSKATIIVNIYKDMENSGNCPEGYFNCHADPCPFTCCSDYMTGKGADKYRQSSKSQAMDIFSSRSGQTARCIKESLVCDGNPNCGFRKNFDESEDVCYPAMFCNCQTLCLTWNYVLTSLAIAVLFIITPTAIVFALFHRRNVALERARLIRLANLRMADMRGEFTRDDPMNDLPPSYEEVHDIKVPPPCFCQAVAMEQPEEREDSLEHCSCKTNEDKDELNLESNAEIGIDAARTITRDPNTEDK